MDYENRHRLRPHDFAILQRFDFKLAPVGFKFFNTEGDVRAVGLEPLEGKMTWCQMLRQAQGGRSFYATAGNHNCEPGIFLTGHGPLDPLAAGGRIGTAFDIYPDERANRRIYNYISRLAEGSTFATGYAPVSELPFDPDLLIIACDRTDQVERVLRSIQWDTGEMIVSRSTYVMGCNWIFTHPYVTGEINTLWTGACHGMLHHQVFAPGMPIVSLPWHHIDRVLRNMNEMPWTMPHHTDEREEAHSRGAARLGVEGII